MLNALSRKAGTPQGGFTLVELMVGLVVGLIVIAAVIAVYLFAVRGSTYYLQSARLNQEIRAASAIIASEVRRAGFWSNAHTPGGALSGAPNPFTAADTDIRIHSFDSGTANCILYSYDRDLLGPGDANQFGFRLADNGVIQMKTDGGSTSDCNSGTWRDLTDSQALVITQLNFQTEESRCVNLTPDPPQHWTSGTDPIQPACAIANWPSPGPAPGNRLFESRQIEFTLAAHAASDPTVTKTHTDSIKGRNPRLITVP